MKPTQGKQNVARHEESWFGITACSISGKRIVAGHVRVNYFDAALLNDTGEALRASRIKRVAKRQSFYVVCCKVKMFREWRLRSYGNEEFMTARQQSV